MSADATGGIPHRANAADHAGQSLTTSDPTMLRALAHPLRIEIMAVLDELKEATATEVGERVGASASNCSFHLRQLERAGYIERAEPRGTAKPWRPVHHSRNLSPDPADPASVRSSAAVGALYVQHEARRMVDYLTAAPEQEPDWVGAVLVNTSTFWATADEMHALREAVVELTEHLTGRDGDPSLRPPGSRKGHLFATLNPDPTEPPTPA